MTGTLETRSESAKQALKNNTLDLTKITMIGTRQNRLNTEIESYDESSKKLNVSEGTKLELFAQNIIQQISDADNILIFEKLRNFLVV